MDFDNVVTDLTKSPGVPFTTLMKLQYEEFTITWKTGRHNLHSDQLNVVGVMKDKEMNLEDVKVSISD